MRGFILQNVDCMVQLGTEVINETTEVADVKDDLNPADLFEVLLEAGAVSRYRWHCHRLPSISRDRSGLTRTLPVTQA